MRYCRFLLIMLAMLVNVSMRAQYNPTNPDEPGTKPWQLTLKSVPSDVGSFNISRVTNHAEGEEVTLNAYNATGFSFANWEDEEGNILSNSSQYKLIMPAEHITLVARYSYNPNNPGEPDQPDQRQYSRIFLQASPADGGSFNVSSGTRFEVGSVADLRASNRTNFTFENWTENGEVISVNSSLQYTVKGTDSYLTANFKYTPGNPGEPSEPSISHHLYLKANPSSGGYFNTSSDNSYVAGTSVRLTAYSNNYYQFRNWTQDGEIISSSASFTYVMPDKTVTLVANYDYIYSPDNPSEPGSSQTEHYYIYGMRENGLAGQTISYPVYLENTGLINGFSIDLAFPLGFTINESGTSLTSRTSGHTLEVKDLGNNSYRIQVRGAENIDGVNDKVVEIPVGIPDTATAGNVFVVGLSKGAVFKADGSQSPINVRDGSLKILRSADDTPDSPDYVVTNVQTPVRTVMPQDVIHIEWQVKNQGNLIGYDGWNERIYLESTSGKKVSIGSVYYETNSLAPNAVVSRSADITLAKLIGMDGAANVSVTIVPSVGSGEIIDYQANNTASTENTPLQVGKCLYLSLPEVSLVEGKDATVRCQLSRSGNWTATEYYDLKKLSGDDRLVVPDKITIPRDQSAAYFYLTINDNSSNDADSVFTVQVSGNGYEAVEGALVVSDNDLASLQMTASKTEVTEGETFELTITIGRPMSEAIPLSLFAEKANRFIFPENIEIPVGETSVTVKVIAVDNDDIETKDNIIIRVYSPGFDESKCSILLIDNDMPSLEFSLSPESVGEDGGPMALIGIIKRTDKFDKRVVLKLSDDSDGLLSYPSQSVILEKNKESVKFNIGVVDNGVLDGDKTVTVIADVFSSSCNCSITGNGVESLQAKVTIVDNESPSLKISFEGTAILEGSKGNVFVISHNVLSANEVKVNISSDRDEILEYDHELIIHSGQTSAYLLVDVNNNGTSDDSNIVTFKVEAEGYASGSCWLLVTDQTLPDAIVSIRPSKKEEKAEDTVDLSIIVKNVGNSLLSGSTPVQFAFSGKRNTTSLTIGENIDVGDSVIIDYNYQLPAITGEYYFEATVNSKGLVPEILLSNNTSEKSYITLLPRFTATANADKDKYLQGDSIVITGTATGDDGKNANVDVYLINNNSRFTLNAKTDETGNYSITWKPLKRLLGHFTIGACYPGYQENETMDDFEIIGITTYGNYSTCYVTVGETYTDKIIISNPGTTRQTQLTLAQKSQSDNCVFSFSTPNSIEAGKTAEINFSIVGNDISQGNSWQRMPVEITTAEGAKLEYILYYYVSPQKAQLDTDTKKIITTMTLNTPREYPLVIRNIGKAETGKITLALPSCIQTTTPKEMASLSQGDSATILLKFMPTDEMKLNVTVKGQFGVNCANGNGLAIGFEITPVSETEGDLKIDVVDEFTFYTYEAPHVENANIQIMNPATFEVLAQGKTDKDGMFSVKLPEGYYAVSVEADKHHAYTSHLIVDPGTEKREEVFLPYDAVTYDYNVTETGVEDEYEIETIGKFETHVPKPIVIMKLPKEAPQPNSIFPVIITNYGLINAVDVNVSLSTNGEFTLEYLNSTSLDTLAAQSSYTLYVQLKPVSSDIHYAPKAEISQEEYCRTIWGYGTFKNLCNKYTNDEIFKAFSKWGYCGLDIYLNRVTNKLGGGGNGGTYPNDLPNPRPGSYDPWYDFGQILSKMKICGDNKPNDNGDDYHPDHNPIVDEQYTNTNDCDEEPYFVFEMASTSNGRKRIGVVADGAAQVKFVLTEGSKIPQEDCGYTYKWILSSDVGNTEDVLGSLSNENTLRNVIFTAPKNYPKDLKQKSYEVKATLYYSNGNISGQTQPIIIKIIRVPVVLLHGINGTNETWFNYVNYLLSEETMYDDFQINNYDYSLTNKSHLKENYDITRHAIAQCKVKHKWRGYEMNQVDLIGYSMGGVLGRFHIQRYRKNNDVHKFISVNTPHSGCEVGDWVQRSPLKKVFAWGAGYRTSELPMPYCLPNYDGLYDLSVNSFEIDTELNGPIISNGKGIPAHVIATCFPIPDEIIIGMKALSYCLVRASRSNIIGFLLSLEFMGIVEDYSLIQPSDLVVSLESQTGGFDSKYVTIINGPDHTRTTKTRDVWDKITDLLKSTTEEEFGKEWFNPIDRKYPSQKKSSSNCKSRSNATNAMYGNTDLNAKVENDSLVVSMNKNDLMDQHLFIVSFGETGTEISDSLYFKCLIPSTFSGNAMVYVFIKYEDETIIEDSVLVNIPEPRTKITSIASKEVMICAGKPSIIQVQCNWADGSVTNVIPESITVDEELASYFDGALVGKKVGEGTVTFSYKGFTCSAPLYVYRLEDDDSDDQTGSSNGICNTVTLSFKQKNVMTRQAFRGTLTIENGYDIDELKDVKVFMEVRDEEGKLATSHEFQIEAESLEGFNGQPSLGASWTLAAGEKGNVTILFIPSKFAAPTGSKDYSFGGSFSYTDPSSGLTVTRQLNPVTLTVDPSPDLEMIYFMQRDIYGDDPMTEEIEPMIPSEFALLVNNKGYGDAENMNLTTRQPQIVDNQKGLAINFEILSTQMNGGEATLAMGSSMTSDFGNIPALSQSYAQWWLQSSLMGHFIEYEVKANHLTSHNNPYLSLIDTVSIHELIHGFTAKPDAEIPIRGFLVNDIPDADDMPDEVYFTDATLKSVNKAGYATFTKRSDTEFLLNVSPSAVGWNYGSLTDPTYGKQELAAIRRLSDNAEIPLDNVWQTHYTLRDGKDPVHENRIHFVFDLLEGGDSYLLSFERRPDVVLQVECFKGNVEENETLDKPLEEISVLFNKPINSSTFTYEDVSLSCQGKKLDASKIGITNVSNAEYKLNLAPLTKQNGFYVLTVYTDDIMDNEGFMGSEGKQFTWIQNDGSGIDEIMVDGNLQIIVAPNPIGDKMYISGSFNNIVNMYVHDVNGLLRMQCQNVAPGQCINVSDLPTGFYILTIETDIGTGKVKVVKI